ncbi:hypothetical protein [Paenibacillus sp. MABNR03]|uniref:hypothetical protein n=1 Tax=Paenibacillus sp. MABNR03 TaxID=3142626 RepID=UPI003D2A3864
MNKTKKKQKHSFSSPAIKLIQNIVSKNKKVNSNNNFRQPNLLKRNKNLNNYIQRIGSLVMTAANQKSYHKGYNSFDSPKEKWTEKLKKNTSDKLNQIGDGFLSSLKGFNSWTADKYNWAKDGTASWVSNNYKWAKNATWSKMQGAGSWTADKYNGAVSWTSNNYKWIKNAAWSKMQGAKSWTTDKYNGAVSWTSNNYKWIKNAAWSKMQGAKLWTADKYTQAKKGVASMYYGAINGGRSILNNSKSWINSKGVAVKEWYENSKEKIKQFFEISDWIIKGKEYGQKVMEGLKNFGYGLSYKMQDMWDHPWTKRVRKVGNNAFKILDFVGSINKVVQAPTPEEKMIEVSKFIGSKVGSAALGTLFGWAGGLIPGAQPAIPIFVGTGAFLGDKGGEKLGEWGGKALTNIWPKSWWPIKKEKTSSVKPTPNMDLDKAKMKSMVSSSTKKSLSNQIHVSLPNGAIQISNSNHKMDYNDLVNQISNQFVKELRKAMENRKTIMA